MNILELLVLLKYILPNIGVGLLIIIIVFLYPEKVEKWGTLLWTIINCIFRIGEKKIITHDIQARVNEFTKSLKKEIVNYEHVRIKIQWITEKETPEEFFRRNKLIIRMRQHANQNRNFVYASMIFIAKALLTKTKKYLSPSQRKSIDLFIGKRLFEKEKPQIIDQFFEDYFSAKVLSSNKIMELVEKYEIIDKVGLFFPVLIQELTFLGGKVFYKPKNTKIIKEVTEFINFLQRYAEREVGEETIPKNFEGTYCRCGIVIIAKRLKREIGKLAPFIKYIKKLLEKKLENIYLIGPVSRGNKVFIDQISNEVQKKFSLQKYTSKKFKAKIKIKGKREEVNNYLVLLRSPEIIRYYDKEYQAKFIE